MTTKWAHLPNAKHIDEVLESVGIHPDEWIESLRTTGEYVSYTEWGVTYDALSSAQFKEDAYDSACASAYVLCDAGCGVLMALIAYEDSAHLLDSTPDEIRLLVALGHPYASLMLPAVTAFQQIGKTIHDI